MKFKCKECKHYDPHFNEYMQEYAERCSCENRISEVGHQDTVVDGHECKYYKESILYMILNSFNVK